MNMSDQSVQRIYRDLQERTKELNCLYKIEDILNNKFYDFNKKFELVVQAIPLGFQFPEICGARIVYEDKIFQTANVIETPWRLCSNINVQERILGSLCVYYMQRPPIDSVDVFLEEEQKLLANIGQRLGNTIFYIKHREVIQDIESSSSQKASKRASGDWPVILDLLRTTDQNLFIQIARKMMNHLCWSGNEEASILLKKLGGQAKASELDLHEESNVPSQRKTMDSILHMSDEIFKLAENYLEDKEILELIHKWIQEDKASFLLKTIENNSSTLAEIVDALTRYRNLAAEISPPAEKGLKVSLIRRFFFARLEFINIAKQFIEVSDFYDLMQNIIHPTGGRGRLGGKSAGLFLASKILRKSEEVKDILDNVKIPKTWFVTSDSLVNFLHYNNLEDVVEQKYKEIDQIRMEYPQIIQMFKNSYFPPEIVKGLALALDDFGDRPLIVRSSSLLEDSLGTAFSGKYKSLFIANQGNKKRRLEALMDAIAEVYASTFSPDPIQYRTERGLLDFNEEMGILLQEVVGTKMGRYFLPSFAGVAFSNNEFRWSPRIKREDGLIRLVPGLGTRAVDRLSDDYPILIAPGQPNLKVNISPDEMLRYSPHKIDVINMETNSFETVEITDLLRESGAEFPGLKRLVSIYKDGQIKRPGALIDYDTDTLVVTFEGLIKDTKFVSQLHSVLQVLKDNLNCPVDIEFASDGKDFYLLQCRPQSYSSDNSASPIPQDIPKNRIIFTAKRYISNGRVPDITHIVYVDPDRYSQVSSLEDLNAIGWIVAQLNKLLPKRQFILMGPGRWGSRGDIKLGVKVTYSDFNKTAMLIEIAKKKGNYTPELSFGTHFFQDLVESNIRYLPLYPDDPEVIFNERFLLNSYNILPDILPSYQHLADTVRVIDVPKSYDGRILRILMNADLEEAVGFLSLPSSVKTIASPVPSTSLMSESSEQVSDDHWQWRMRMAEKIASELDPDRFGVKALYVFGSTKNGTAQAGSDIDLLIHFTGTAQQKTELMSWLEGWSLCLGELNYLRTGYASNGLLDVQVLTDADIERKSSYAVKIGAITDPAKPLSLKKRSIDFSDTGGNW